jgi:RecB family exonuclease
MEDVIKPIKISASSVQTYEQCPRRWFYRYIQKLYPKVPEEEWTQFGNFIHDVAEHYTGGTLEEFKKLAAEKLKKYVISPTYKHKVIPAIKNLYVFCNQRFQADDVIDRERKIEIPYRENFILTGKLDILHVRNNTVTIIDWKSSKAEKDHSFQLAFYKLLLDLFDIVKTDVLHCEIVYLCATTQDDLLYVEKYQITKTEADDAIRRIEALIRTYKYLGTTDKEKWRMKPGPLCEYCDFFKAKICEGKKH